MILLVAYDITEDRRRARVMKALARLGRRVQYSVFLIQRATPEEVAATLTPFIDAREDKVRIHPLCAGCDGRAVMLGVAELGERAAGFRVI